VAYGPSGVGKSLALAALAVAVATGSTFCERAVKRGSVLFIALERAGVTLRRLHGAADGNPLPVAVWQEPLDLCKIESTDLLVDTISEVEMKTELPVEMIVIDGIVQAIPGADENSVRDMGVAVATLNAVIRRTRATIFVITHPRKNARGIRGSSVLDAAADAILAFGRDQNGPFFGVEKLSDGTREPRRIRFQIDETTTPDGYKTACFAATGLATPNLTRQKNDPASVRLPSDSRTALGVLVRLVEGNGSANIEDWREQTYAALGSRSQDALRRAFLTARQRLLSNGWITTDGQSVSVNKREDA